MGYGQHYGIVYSIALFLLTAAGKYFASLILSNFMQGFFVFGAEKQALKKIIYNWQLHNFIIPLLYTIDITAA